MKKFNKLILLLLVIILPAMAFAQDAKRATILVVADSTTVFGRSLAEGSLIINKANGKMYITTAYAPKTSTFNTTTKEVLDLVGDNLELAGYLSADSIHTRIESIDSVNIVPILSTDIIEILDSSFVTITDDLIIDSSATINDSIKGEPIWKGNLISTGFFRSPIGSAFGYQFGSNQDYIYSGVAGTVSVKVGNIIAFRFTNGKFGGTGVTEPNIRNASMTHILPGFIGSGDETTGLSIRNDTNCIIINNVSLFTVSEDTIYNKVVTKIGNAIVYTPSSDQSLLAATQIPVTYATMRVVGNGGAVTLTGTPTIVVSEHGTRVVIYGTSDVNTVQLQDESSLPGSKLQMSGGIDFTLGLHDNIIFEMDEISGFYFEISRSDN